MLLALLTPPKLEQLQIDFAALRNCPICASLPPGVSMVCECNFFRGLAMIE